MGDNRTELWIYVEDFNDISHHREKVGADEKTNTKLMVSLT